MSCLRFYLFQVPLLAFFKSWPHSSSGLRPPHFRRFVIQLRHGLHGATLYATRQRVHQQLLNSLAAGSERVKLKSFRLHLLFAG
jgi:hypothetical protein